MANTCTILTIPLRIQIELIETDMQETLKQKMIDVCSRKIAQKGPNVGLSFYAFFSNKNDDPKLLMEAAQWWILRKKFDHFEKAVKIKSIVESEDRA